MHIHIQKDKRTKMYIQYPARRREEFLAKKQHEPSPRISVENSATAKEIKCDRCEYVAATEKGLRQHIRMKHKEMQLEVLRSSEDAIKVLFPSALQHQGGTLPEL